MATYITQTDVEDFWGTNNVTDWADMENDGTGTAARITRAIAYGAGKVESLLCASRYQTRPIVPLDDNADQMLTTYVSVFAGQFLLNNRTLEADEDYNKYDKLIRHFSQELNQIVSGALRPNWKLSHSGPTAPEVIE